MPSSSPLPRSTTSALLERRVSPRTLANRELYGSVRDRVDRIADVLRVRFAGAARVGALADATGIPPTIVGSTLGTMARDGLVRRHGRTWILEGRS